tara:strand:- start:538 stop:2040 length:1503 start_codon:yes stop_codon:yes gene_type:complete
MEYTFNNINEIAETRSIKGYSCVVEEKPLPVLQGVFDDMKKEYIRARNITTEMFISDYGEEEGKTLMIERYPMPVNIDELPNQAKIIANKYELCGTTLVGTNPGFIVKMPNVRVRVRTYCNLGDYYCWIQKYGIDKFELKIYQAMPNEEGYLIFGGATYPHPHIAGPNPCLGSFDGVIKNAAGHFNMVGVLSNIKTYLNSYYGRSVYLRHTEFRPVKIRTLPIELLKKYPANQLNWSDFYHQAFKDDPLLQPEATSDEYAKLHDSYNREYEDNRILEEIKPHECNFYNATFNYSSALMAYHSEVVHKIRLVAHKFCVDYFQAYALFMTYAINMNGNPVKFRKENYDYKVAWEDIRAICIDGGYLNYRIGYNRGTSLTPDETMSDAGNLETKAYDIYKLLYPGQDEVMYRLRDMRCNDFWEYIDKFKSIDEFLIPQDNYDEREQEAVLQIEALYPKVMAYKDAFSRKILITLDKQKRRIQNGLKHTTPTPESNQLSFETLS